jgi:hypothetical protein
MRAALRIGAGLLLLLLAAALATYVAGEQTEVARLRSFDAQGAAHETKLWVVDHEGAPWVRVANPRRAWFRRLAANPRAELVRGQQVQAVVAEPHDSDAARAALDRRFREKYGLVDWWYGVLLRRHPIPLRLAPAPAQP